MPHNRPVLLGTFLDDTPRALIKMPSGQTHMLETGALLNGDEILVIEDGRIALDHNGTARWLTIP
ncbi:hypothetical protein ATO11_15485 [Pseudaestuariivita atlantica]|uniref:Uncharacterized protein n=1 Tax=Pseudaestuariivita atlantica TaxID=1317121 RepID=A0A0L1JMK0_9RHOB|nr:hypothetical protein ATO11_15485 [Pseudaestuariivita atlantica]